MATHPIIIALHFVNVAQHLNVRRCVPLCPPACGNAARLQRSEFARRDQMRRVQVSNIRARDPNIPVPSSNFAVLPARVIACQTKIRPCFTDRAIYRRPCSTIGTLTTFALVCHVALDPLCRSAHDAHRRRGRDNVCSRKGSHEPYTIIRYRLFRVESSSHSQKSKFHTSLPSSTWQRAVIEVQRIKTFEFQTPHFSVRVQPVSATPLVSALPLTPGTP